MKLSAEQIAKAKEEVVRLGLYEKSNYPPLHEHDDCIRIAYEWLDAQTRIKSRNKRGVPVKSYAERWAGRYVSSSDVVVAAHLLGLPGCYPYFHISSRLIWPNRRRLEGIGQAMTQENYLDKRELKLGKNVSPRLRSVSVMPDYWDAER